MDKTDSLRQLANIGPVTEKKLKQIGIFSRKEFLARDPYEVFATLREKVDPTLCRCARRRQARPALAPDHQGLGAGV
jgi:predicted flap endonuclease-1-like 5' DNA nuclease